MTSQSPGKPQQERPDRKPKAKPAAILIEPKDTPDANARATFRARLADVLIYLDTHTITHDKTDSKHSTPAGRITR